MLKKELGRVAVPNEWWQDGGRGSRFMNGNIIRIIRLFCCFLFGEEIFLVNSCVIVDSS